MVAAVKMPKGKTANEGKSVKSPGAKGAKGAKDAEELDSGKEEVMESAWLGKALRRQKVRERLESMAEGKKESQKGKDMEEEEEDIQSEEEEEEKLGAFSFDAEDNSLEELTSGWNFKSKAVGAEHKRDPKGRNTSMSDKISKRAKHGVEIVDEDDDEDEEEEEEDEEMEGDESDASHISDEEEEVTDRELAEGEEEEDGEDEEEDDEEEDDEEGASDAEGGGSEMPRDKSEQEQRAEKEAAFFDDAPVLAASTNSFTALNLSRPLLKATAAMGFVSPTSIQSMVVPIALQGKDICASARTGSGKTAAFALPFLERLLYRPKRIPAIRVLVLTPTRELAVQVHSMVQSLAQCTDIRVFIVIGGVKNQEQEVELRKKPDVVVATPGRMIDHIRNAPGVGVEGLEVLVLDEADRLLEMGFTEEVQELVKLCPVNRQTLLFSATMTHDVDKLAAYSLKRPSRITADGSIRTNEEQGELNKVAVPATLQQEFVRIRKEHEGQREAILLALCTRSFHKRTIIFAREKRRAHRLRIIFGLAGLKVDELHGNLTQAQRLEALENFKQGKCDFLIATDLAGRGLDIKGVDVVINFEIPRSLAEYVHRVGRTARAGRKGCAVTLADDTPRTKKMLKDIVRSAPDVVKRRVVPPDTIEALRDKIEGMEADLDAIVEEEKVERELRIADMEEEKARNMASFQDDIMNRPKKTWFQSKMEKKAASQRNPNSARQLDKGKGRGDDDDDETNEPQISKKKVIGNSKDDKYAGMSRKKRRNTQAREEDEMEEKRERALQKQREKDGESFFAEDSGQKKGQKKVLSQRAAKSAVRKGTLDINANKQALRDARKKRKRDGKATEDHSSKRMKTDDELFREAVDKELNTSAKRTAKKKNKKQGAATRKSFKSKTRMKRRK